MRAVQCPSRETRLIIIVNSSPAARAHAIAAMLAARAEAGVALQLDVDCPDRAAAPAREQGLDVYVEAAARALLEARAAGAGLATLGAALYFGETLRALRQRLDRHDDVIYAYRVDAAVADDAASDASDWRSAQAEGVLRFDMGFEIPAREPEAAAAAIWDDVHQPVDLARPDPRWTASFEREHAAIAAALGDLALSIEHVGSTAVPGLVAKPIIDIVVTVQSLDDPPRWLVPLRCLGYAFIDFPQNRERRFLCRGSPRSHHVHLVAHGSAEHLDKLAFRDALRADQALRDEYQALKQAAAAALRTERAQYGERKSLFVRRVLSRARGANSPST